MRKIALIAILAVFVLMATPLSGMVANAEESGEDGVPEDTESTGIYGQDLADAILSIIFGDSDSEAHAPKPYRTYSKLARNSSPE